MLPIFLMFSSTYFRYSLRCLVAVSKDADCVKTIQTAEEKLADKKKELETFQVGQPRKHLI